MKWRYPAIIILIILGIASFGIWISNGEELRIKGSDTELQLVANFSEAYSDINPQLVITVEGGGSGTGIASLINKQIDIANSSRLIDEEELEEARKRGVDPKKFIIARDGLAVIVNPENPIENLSVENISDIFSGEIKNWSDFGWGDKKINLYGRRSTSGTYIFFRNHILGRNYSAEMYNMPGSQSIVNGVKEDSQGIGYVGAGYVTTDGSPIKGVKILDVAENFSSIAYSPLDPVNIEEGNYPIARPLYQYTDGIPPENSPIYDFLKFELYSEEAREIIIDTGFFPPMPVDSEHNRLLLENGDEL